MNTAPSDDKAAKDTTRAAKVAHLQALRLLAAADAKWRCTVNAAHPTGEAKR